MTIHQDNTHNHFSKIAPLYRDIRTTDLQPIRFISKRLKDLKTVRAADIGCGAGRYSLLLFKHLNKLHLTCIDVNESMLKETSAYLKRNDIDRFILVKAHASDLPLKDNLMDCVFTFNAIHHFHFLRFVEKAVAITKEDGFAFKVRMREISGGDIFLSSWKKRNVSMN